MMTDIIPRPGSAGRLFTIGPEAWSAIDARVAVVIDDRAIAAEISRIVPNYAWLLEASLQWRSSTFPGLVAEAAQVAMFAGQAAQTLSDLAASLRGLRPGDPLPAPVRFIVTVQFGALAETAVGLRSIIDRLGAAIDAFVRQNREADKALQAVVAPLGPGWRSLAGPIATLEGATAQVRAGWATIAATLTRAAAGKVALTSATLLALDIRAAITAWSGLEREAAAFAARLAPARPSARTA